MFLILHHKDTILFWNNKAISGDLSKFKVVYQNSNLLDNPLFRYQIYFNSFTNYHPILERFTYQVVQSIILKKKRANLGDIQHFPLKPVYLRSNALLNLKWYIISSLLKKGFKSPYFGFLRKVVLYNIPFPFPNRV